MPKRKEGGDQVATIRTAIALYDGVTSPLQSMTKAMNIVLNSFESMQRASSRAVDSSAIQEAREELARTEVALDGIEKSIRESDQEQRRFNSSLRGGSSAADSLWSKIKGIAAAVGGMMAVQEVLGLSDQMVGVEARLSLIVDDGGSASELGDKIMASAIENAPLLTQAIEQYMTDTGVASSMQDWAAEALLTAEVIKAALFSTSDQVEARFGQIPMTWEEICTSMQNRAMTVFDPILNKINAVLNTESFNGMIDGIINGLAGIASVAIPLMDGLMAAIFGIYENLSWIVPVVLGVVGAFLVYRGAMLLLNIANTIHNVLEGVAIAQAELKAGKTLLQAAATKNAAGAQVGLNAALLACPVFWIVIGIIALIAIIYAVCAAIAKFTGVATSGFGVICGGVMVVVGFFKNLWLFLKDFALGIGEALKAIAENIGIFFSNTIAGIQSWFYNLLSTALTVVDGICKALNNLPFVEFDYSGITGAASDYAAKAAEADAKKKEYVDVSDAFDKGMGTYDFNPDGWASKAFASAAAWGDSKVSGLFKSDQKEDPAIEDYMPQGLGDFGAQGFGSDGLGNTMDGIYGSTGDTAENTAAMADAMEMSEEDLSLLRDIAEREAINRFTTAEIKVDMINNNSLATNMDLDGMVNVLESKVTQALMSSAEGVHV